MIYITLGTQGRDFSRCLRMVEELIRERGLKDRVIAQVGATKYRPQGVECFEFVDEMEYQKYVQEADVIITHAGSGALFSCIKKGKKAIAVARLSEYGEMIDNHQTELVRKLSEEGYILDGTYSLIAAWDKLCDFKPRQNDFKCTLTQNISILLKKWGIEQKE
jgi:UDP-N-acetylglucosamine transferase subunit ALG13